MYKNSKFNRSIGHHDELITAIVEAKKLIAYYSTGPLGDIPAAANRKIVEEALRHVLTEMCQSPVTTNGMVDLGVKDWQLGFQVKTFRRVENLMIFARSNKIGKENRIADIKQRIVKSMTRSGAKHLILLDVNMKTMYMEIYHLATLSKGVLKTHGSFLKDAYVHAPNTDTHFKIRKSRLRHLA